MHRSWWLVGLVLSMQLVISGRNNSTAPSGKLVAEQGLPFKAARYPVRAIEPSTVLARAIPFELNANKIYLRVSINHEGPFWFILDSGAIFNVLDKDRTQALGIQLYGSSKVRGVGEASVDATNASRVSLEIKDLELKEQDFTVLPINSLLSHSEGRQIDGLLGFEFIRRYCIEIDYQNRVLNIFAPKDCPDAGAGQVLPVEIENNALYVSGMITVSDNQQVPGRFLIDTAVRSALALNTPFVESNHLLERVGRTIPAMGVGIGGKTGAAVGRVEGLHLGGLLIKQPVVDFSAMQNGVLASRNFSGIIGGETLRRFKVILDCSHDRLILVPDSNSQRRFEHDMSGLFVLAEGKDLKTFRVLQVIDHSPASEAGLRPDDVIQVIDGYPASALSLEQISQLFKHGAGENHELLLKRGQQEFKTTIKLRRLI